MVLVIDADKEQKSLSAQLQQVDKEFFRFQGFCGSGLLNWLSLSSAASVCLNLILLLATVFQNFLWKCSLRFVIAPTESMSCGQ